MFLQLQKAIEDRIVETLQDGPITSINLITTVQRLRPHTTKQGVYRALRKLQNQEVIVMHQKNVSLNSRWLNDLHQFSTLASHRYFQDVHTTGGFLQLQEGDNISYTFHSLNLADASWVHILYLLLQIVPSSEQFFGYNPHVWFLYARFESERALMRTVAKDRHYFMTAGHNTPLDKTAAQFFHPPKSQYYTSPQSLFTDERYYLNILGPYMIEVWIDGDLAQDIDVWYQSTLQLTEDTRAQLTTIVHREAKAKLKISRNAAKAQRLRNKLKHFFYIPIKKITHHTNR